MRTALNLGRTCLRQTPQRAFSTCLRFERQFNRHTSRRWLPKPPAPSLRHRVTLYTTALSPAVFVALSEEDDGDGKTPEEHMLEASRAELAQKVPDDVHGLKRAWKEAICVIDYCIIEPVATVFRFFHLVVIFVPVIGATPVIFFGSRVVERHNERAGTLWWYSFLVHSMERAGPAFIKVSCFYPS